MFDCQNVFKFMVYMSSCVYNYYIYFFEFILTQLVMFGCLECTCPDTVKLILKVWVSQRQIGMCDQKVNARLHGDNKLD